MQVCFVAKHYNVETYQCVKIKCIAIYTVYILYSELTVIVTRAIDEWLADVFIFT